MNILNIRLKVTAVLALSTRLTVALKIRSSVVTYFHETCHEKTCKPSATQSAGVQNPLCNQY